ncbi:YlbF family regulator [Clostridium sp. D2Q-14]|uniref:YlbF family regulator n=1 Tax=Anaeromonas gelatinilytica TaxID=2683194 RepID=UPI00193B4DDB|nr:YlbF family regulator [Anaeromonas gelatinilytica]MBS4535970.1 YlbF family regulator [Anaeromonas gelatinilytica]
MNNILDMARDLGQSIQESEILKDYLQKEENFHKDQDAINLQNKIQVKSKKLNQLIIERKTENINNLKLEIENLKQKLIENENYREYNIAKSKIEKIMENINNILEYYTGINNRSGCTNCSKKCNK